MSGIGIKPFAAKRAAAPATGGVSTGTLAVGSTSERQTLVASGGRCLGAVAVLTQAADSVAFIEFGLADVTAVASSGADGQRSSQPIPPGVLVVLGLPAGGATHFAAVCFTGGAAVVMVTVGDGV